MTLDAQSAALGWTVGCELGEDEVTARAHSGRRPAGVRDAIGWIGQEVKRGPIVPHVHGSLEGQGAHVRLDERHSVGHGERRPEAFECDAGDVDRDELSVAAVDQMGDQCRLAGADDRHKVRRHRHAAHEGRSRLR
ncbi:hypothetical protein BH18ACT3_BH18ACT3_05010 [soil metagenome]